MFGVKFIDFGISPRFIRLDYPGWSESFLLKNFSTEILNIYFYGKKYNPSFAKGFFGFIGLLLMK